MKEIEKIKVGESFFWKPTIFPYRILEEDAEYVTYKRPTHGWTNAEEYAKKTVCRHVFEDAINRGEIEFISKIVY